MFKKCCVEKAYHLLGAGTTQDLEKAWTRLYSEFLIISEDEHAHAMIEQLARIDFLSSRISRVKGFCESLGEKWNELDRKCLRDCGYMYDFSEATYKADIARTLRKLLNHENELQQLVKTVTDFIKDRETGGNETPYAVFDENVTAWAKVFKVYVEPKTAQNYALLLKDLREYARRQQEKITEDA